MSLLRCARGGVRRQASGVCSSSSCCPAVYKFHVFAAAYLHIKTTLPHSSQTAVLVRRLPRNRHQAFVCCPCPALLLPLKHSACPFCQESAPPSASRARKARCLQVRCSSTSRQRTRRRRVMCRWTTASRYQELPPPNRVQNGEACVIVC